MWWAIRGMGEARGGHARGTRCGEGRPPRSASTAVIKTTGDGLLVNRASSTRCTVPSNCSARWRAAMPTAERGHRVSYRINLGDIIIGEHDI
jgi:hypothetical protein